MKRILLTLGLILLAGLSIAAVRTRSGDSIDHVVDTCPGVPWENMGNLTASLTAPIVTARDYSEVWTDIADANSIKWTAPPEAETLELRFSTDADGDSTTVNIYVCTGATDRDGVEENFTLGSTLVLTGGTQTGNHSNVFVDTITETEYALVGSTIAGSAGNTMCIWRTPTFGYKKFVIVATNLQGSTTLYADARWY